MSVPGGSNPLLFSSAAVAPGGGYAIERSLRFNSSDSAYLSRTPASAGNRKTWTWAGWVKRCGGNNETLFSVKPTTGYQIIGFDADSIRIEGNVPSMNVVTAAVYRDPSAWFHVVIQFDTTQATPANRTKIYVNGVEQPFQITSYPALNDDQNINTVFNHRIGNYDTARYFNGYLADIHFIDGQALDPTSFGRFDANGIWQPIEYSDVLPGPVTLVPSIAEGALIIKADDATITGFVSAAGFVKVHSSSDGINWTYREQILSGALSFSAKYIAIGGGSTNSRTFNPSTGGSYTWAEYSAGTQFDTTSNITLNVTGLSYTPNSTVTAPYGTNGFHLDFADNSTAAALGTDTSGNGNDWTVNNISVAAGAGNDSLVDVPTNGTETDTGVGGEVRGNYCTLNPLAVNAGGGGTFSEGNLRYVGPSSWRTTRGTFNYPSTGKWYYEATLTGTLFNVYAAAGFGVVDSFKDWYYYTNYQVTVIDNGVIYEQESPLTTFTPSNGGVLGIAVDRDANTYTIYWNGSQVVSRSIPFTAGIELAPSATSYNASYGTWNYNFGQRPFAYPVSGFKTLCTANLPAPVVTKPSTVMDVKLYTGNGSTQTITGLEFSPDLVWIKNRAQADNHKLLDTVRGATEELESNTTDAEVTNADGLTAFNSDGFDLGADVEYNTSTEAYAAWTWDAGSSTVTNADGSITSQVRANPSAGFSIVTYTGNATAGATVGHGLGVAPKWVIVKNRSALGSWLMWVKEAFDIDPSYYMTLNSTSAATGVAAAFNSQAPTSTVFTLGTVGATNGSGQSLIAYCFAPVAGYSSFGSYTGNGSADGPFVFTNMRAKWILIKRTDTTGNWWIFDAARDPYNVARYYLLADDSGAEVDNTTAIDLLSNGFKLRTTSTGLNASAGTYIYAAFSEAAFSVARAR